MIIMKKRLNISVFLKVMHWIIPPLLSLSTIGAYVKINKKFLNIADLMTFLEIIDDIRNPIIYLPEKIKELINAFASFNRISFFLRINTEKKINLTANKDTKYAIKISQANIGLNNQKILMTIDELNIIKGESPIIIGEVDSDKNYLIQTLIDKLMILSKKEFNIDGMISYALKKPFIINDTIKNNIIFYSEYNEEKYKIIIKYCQLDKDIESLPYGDLTQIGSKGKILS